MIFGKRKEVMKKKSLYFVFLFENAVDKQSGTYE
jgi:hypothetical protein